MNWLYVQTSQEYQLSLNGKNVPQYRIDYTCICHSFLYDLKL